MGVHNLPMGYLGVHKLPKVRSFTFFLSLTEEYRKGRHTKIYIHEDLCAATRNKRAEQYPELQEARKNGLAAYFNYTTLVTWPRRERASDASRAADGGKEPAAASGEEPQPATSPHLLVPRGGLTTPRPPHAGITAMTDPRAR